MLAGGQLSARLVPALAVTGTFAWTPNNDQLTPGAPGLDLYQYDLGLEARGAGWFQGDGWAFTPFVGIGGGGRLLWRLGCLCGKRQRQQQREKGGPQAQGGRQTRHERSLG